MLGQLLAVLLLLASNSIVNASREETKAYRFPGWVQPRNITVFWTEYRKNLQALARIDGKGVQMDVAMYGDSITAWSKPLDISNIVRGSRIPWRRHFGDLVAAPLGVPGDRIANLIWRLTVGRELPSNDNIYRNQRRRF